MNFFIQYYDLIYNVYMYHCDTFPSNVAVFSFSDNKVKDW